MVAELQTQEIAIRLGHDDLLPCSPAEYCARFCVQELPGTGESSVSNPYAEQCTRV